MEKASKESYTNCCQNSSRELGTESSLNLQFNAPFVGKAPYKYCSSCASFNKQLFHREICQLLKMQTQQGYPKKRNTVREKVE